MSLRKRVSKIPASAVQLSHVCLRCDLLFHALHNDLMEWTAPTNGIEVPRLWLLFHTIRGAAHRQGYHGRVGYRQECVPGAWGR